jgi:hypothetical protein
MITRTRILVAGAAAGLGLLATAPVASADTADIPPPEPVSVCTPVATAGVGEPTSCLVMLAGGVVGTGGHTNGTDLNNAICGPIQSFSSGEPNECDVNIIGDLLGGTHTQQ